METGPKANHMVDRPASQRVQRILTLTSERVQRARGMQLVGKTSVKKTRLRLDRLEAAVVLLSLCFSERHRVEARITVRGTACG